MVKRKRRIPKNWIIVDKDFGTRYVQDKKTGKMIGRKSVQGRGDGTALRRVHHKGSSYDGQIFGRTESIPVRGSSNSRATLRRRLD